MKGTTCLLLVPLLLTLLFASESRAQTQEILGGNLLNGAITGSMLGAATMGLQNSDDFTPLRVGLGTGILGGIGIAVNDMASRPRGSELFVNGFFNQGSNSSIIILLDTMYGTAGGALIGMASMLIADRRIAEGLQYGASAGAWAGFTFGLFDAFYLSDRHPGAVSELLQRKSVLEFNQSNYHVGLIHPAVQRITKVHSGSIHMSIEPSLNLIAFRVKL